MKKRVKSWTLSNTSSPNTRLLIAGSQLPLAPTLSLACTTHSPEGALEVLFVIREVKEQFITNDAQK